MLVERKAEVSGTKAVKNRENACSGTRQTNGRVPGYPLSPPPQKKKFKKTEIFFLQSIKHIILYCGPFCGRRK